MDRLVSLDSNIDFVGKEALQKIKDKGITRKQVGIEIECEPLKGPNTTFWKVLKDNTEIGKITSAVYSPRLKKNIALAMISIDNSELGTILDVEISSKKNKATVVEKPFYDPKKKLASS